jgi:flagellar hook-associated protein 2
VGTTAGLTNSFNAKAVSTVNADPNVNVANVSLSGSSAVAGTYDLVVSKLAQAHQIGSAKQAQSTVALGYSGTFIIGGEASRSALPTTTTATVTGFGTGGSIRANQLELGSGDYFVEFKQESGAWQFRLVDANGAAVSIDDAADVDTAMTSQWQDFSQVKNSTFDTGRGLTIDFANVDPTQQQLFGDAGIAAAAYTAQGASLAVAATDTLNDIRNKINAATFADGNKVQATVVDKRLVLTAASTGLNQAIKLFDSSYSGTNGNGVLKSLGIEVNNVGALTDAANDQLRAAQDAEFTINTISITRSRNTGLTDVVQGLSIDLKAQGSSTVSVAKDNAKVVTDVKGFVEKLNDLLTFIKNKTEATMGKTNERGNPTYTPAALGSDWNMRSLRSEMASDLLGGYSGAVGNAPKYLYQLGITLNEEGLFALSDESKFTAALNDNAQGAQDLLGDMLGKLDSRLNKYVTGTESIISYTKTGLDSELKTINERIESFGKRLTAREEALRTQYSAIQSMLINMTYQYQSFAAISSGNFNRQY